MYLGCTDVMTNLGILGYLILNTQVLYCNNYSRTWWTTMWTWATVLASWETLPASLTSGGGAHRERVGHRDPHWCWDECAFVFVCTAVPSIDKIQLKLFLLECSTDVFTIFGDCEPNTMDSCHNFCSHAQMQNACPRRNQQFAWRC